MKNNFIYSYRYGLMSISLTWDTLLKLIQYVIYSTISILIGYFYTSKELNIDITISLISILPVLYIFNYSYYIIADFIFKYIVDKVTWIKDENKNNIWQTHALFLNLIVVYFFFKAYLCKQNVFHSTHGVILILIIFTIFNFLHRILREFDYQEYKGCCNIYLGKKLFSLLRYKSYTHAHVLAGSVIAVPFLIGLLLGNEVVDNRQLLTFLGFSYFLFILSWVILHQHKCKAWEFIRSIKFILPCSVYPIFPIIYFVFFDNSIFAFYTLYSLLSLLYLCPLLYISFTHKEKIEWINEKLILVLLLAAILFSLIYRIINPDSFLFPKIIASEYTAISGFTAALLGSTISIFVMTLNREENAVNKFFRIYIVLPYGVIALIHAIFTITSTYMHISPLDNSLNINYLSSHVSAILCLYAMVYITIVIFRFVKISLKN